LRSAATDYVSFYPNNAYGKAQTKQKRRCWDIVMPSGGNVQRKILSDWLKFYFGFSKKAKFGIENKHYALTIFFA
jgi:hypothetical protein